MQAALTTLLTLTLLTPLAIAQSPEQTLLQLTNQSRAEHHLAPLTWDPALARAAQTHAARIAQEGGSAMHQYPGEPDLIVRAGQAGAHFSTVAENVASNVLSPAQLHELWMSTPTHRANILDPNLTAIGIAFSDSNGIRYAVEDFGRTTAVLTSSTAERQVLQLLREHGIQPATSAQAREDAQRNCDSNATAQTHPTLIMQWESSDLTKLPPELLQRLPARPTTPQTAAVAACPAQQPTPGFTTYRIAVLIY